MGSALYPTEAHEVRSLRISKCYSERSTRQKERWVIKESVLFTSTRACRPLPQRVCCCYRGRGRLSLMTFLLFAPAMFFWGVETGTIGQDTFGLSKFASAVFPIAATIVLPVLDSLFGSGIPDWCYDKVLVPR